MHSFIVCEKINIGGHHHILSRQCVIQAWAVSVQSLRSKSVQWGPSVHSERMWCIVCLGWPQGHSLLGASPYLCMLLVVFPTLALALLSVTQLFLGRYVPVGSCSLGVCMASFVVEQSHSFHFSSRQLADCSGWRLSTVMMKLFLDLSLLSVLKTHIS